MRILHAGPLNVKAGGPTLSTYLAVKGIECYGCDAAIIAMPLNDGDKWYADDVTLYTVNQPSSSKYGHISHLQHSFASLPNYDVIHLQGLWMHFFHGAASYARKKGIPYVISLRGNLYPQALAHSGLAKKLSLILYQNKDLQKAACIHATCDDELKYYRDLGFKNPVAVIPNPISTDGIIDREIPLKKDFVIGYLGRLHPRKRVEKLIYAVDFLKKNNIDVKLKIIGSDDANYEAFLKSEVERLNLDNVSFTGFLVGEQKDKAISDLSVLACVSDFENFGNIVTEALVRGVPVLTTKGMPWKCLPENNCGWWIDNNQDTVNKSLLEIAKIPNEALRDMGENGKKLILKDYSVDAVGRKLSNMYKWILKGGKTPDFIHLV